MKKLSLLTFALLFLQPVVTDAATIPAHSPRVIRQMYEEQNQKRLSARGLATQSYAKVGDITPALPANGLSVGPANAPVTIVEFVDYACPSCAQFESQTLPALKSAYIDTGKLRFVVRNFPISYHEAAYLAANVVECARNQSDDLAWKMHDAFLQMLMQNGELTQDDVYSVIKPLNGIIDTEAMYECIDFNQKQSVVSQDIADATNGGINGTPSFWVLGPKGKAELIQGAVPLSTFQKVLKTMLQ